MKELLYFHEDQRRNLKMLVRESNSKSLTIFLEELPSIESLQKIIKEPLKFLKDPIWNFLALMTLENPSIKIHVEFFLVSKTRKFTKDYFHVSKDSIEKLRKPYENYTKSM